MAADDQRISKVSAQRGDRDHPDDDLERPDGFAVRRAVGQGDDRRRQEDAAERRQVTVLFADGENV